MNQPINVLLVEDRHEDAELLLREMRRGGLDIVSQRVDSQEALEAALDSSSPDLVLSDYTLPGFGGMSALEIVRQRLPDTPFIFVSGTIGEERAIEALRQGATDYVLKGNRARLVPAIRRALEETQEREARRRAERELKDSEQRFRSALRFSAIGMALLAPDGRWLEVNQALCKIVGYSEEELLATDFQSITHPDDLAANLAQVRRMLAHEIETFQLEMRYVRKTGGLVWVLLSVSQVWRSTGEPQYFIAQVQDFTERRRHEEKIRRLSRMHAVLSGINSTIVRVRDRKELFRDACRIAVELGGFRMAWIGVAGPDEKKVMPVAWTGFEDGYLEEVGRALRDFSEGIGTVGRVLREKRLLVCNDIQADAEVVFKEAALSRGYRSFAALPLLMGGKMFGVMVLYAAEIGFFDQDELKLLSELAGDISFAVDYIGKEERLAYLAYYDPLTGLANRQLLIDRLTQAMQTATAKRYGLAVMVIDLQRFKSINDTLGRSAGDQVLQELADRLRHTFTDSATIARISGDRFAVIVANMRGPTLARALDQWVLQSLGESLLIQGMELRPIMKIGIATFPGDGETAEALFMNAEAALKRAKGTVNSYVFYSPDLNARVAQRLYLENRLRTAVEKRQFVLHYQPQVSLATQRIEGLEALIRWRDPEHGLVSPIEFIPMLEESGLIVEVGRWVIEQAIADMRAWAAQRLAVPRVAVNVSEVQLREKDFVATVLAAMGPAEGRPNGIDLEITESLFAQDADANVDKLDQLRAAGARVAMDDFGTGYSSLSQIAKLPLDALKIDQAFIAGMAGNPEHRVIVSTIINLGEALEILVIAEGVETEQQADELRSFGCDAAQGYLFSRPLPAEDLARLLAAGPLPAGM